LERGSAYLTQQIQTLTTNGEDPGTDRSVQNFLTNLANSPQQGGDVTVAVTFSKAPASSLQPIVSYPDSRVDLVRRALSPQLEHQVADLGMIAHQVVTLDGNTYLVYGKPVYTRWTRY